MVNSLGSVLDNEKIFGRIRKKRNESRIIDLDIVDYKNQIISLKERLYIPHPRMHKRAFVLLPLQEINPLWVHPVNNIIISSLIKKLDKKQKIKKII